MTAMLEMKQKIRVFYSQHDMIILPILKFILAFITFTGINSTLGFMEELNSIFIVLILSILCSLLPINAIVVFGFVLIIGHSYGLGLEVAAFALALLILLTILFLRFSTKDNLALILTPIGFGLRIPTAIPVACGLLRNPLSAVPASCGVILYHLMKLLKDNSAILRGKDTEILDKMKLLLDGLVKNQEMWLTMLAFVIVIMLTYLVRKMSVDYSWHIAIVGASLLYVAVVAAGGLFLDIETSISGVLISAAGALVIGFIIEFFAMGVDYSRTENLQYEDDEYVYYVKAVPKAFVTTPNREIKSIRDDVPFRDVQANQRKNTGRRYSPRENENFYLDEDEPPLERNGMNNINFEEKLERSLRDL